MATKMETKITDESVDDSVSVLCEVSFAELGLFFRFKSGRLLFVTKVKHGGGKPRYISGSLYEEAKLEAKNAIKAYLDALPVN